MLTLLRFVKIKVLNGSFYMKSKFEILLISNLAGNSKTRSCGLRSQSYELMDV